jgi:hypothetical protein
MARRHSGFTRASSLGPIAEILDRQGASIARVLKAVDIVRANVSTGHTVPAIRFDTKLLALGGARRLAEQPLKFIDEPPVPAE